jgi:hypothetical protein
MSAEEIGAINPNSGTAPIFRTRRDKEITSAIYTRVPVLVDRSTGIPTSDWPITFSQMINMASDSESFRDVEELGTIEAAWPISNNRYQSAKGDWLPLYEGKMVQSYDHRASDIVLAAANVFRPGQGSDLSDTDHGDPARFARPRFWILEGQVPWPDSVGWCIGLKDVTSVTNARTTIAAIIPKAGAGHTLPVLLPARRAVDGPLRADEYIERAPLLIANINCIVFDYLARQKVHGNHLAWYLLEQVPVVSEEAYSRAFGTKTAADIVRSAVLELTYTADDLAEFARDMGFVDAAATVNAPFAWNENRRRHLQAKIDALYFILYGIYDPADPAQSRNDIEYIFSTFPIVEREDVAEFGRYRTRDLTLAYVNALVAGKPDAIIEG